MRCWKVEIKLEKSHIRNYHEEEVNELESLLPLIGIASGESSLGQMRFVQPL